MHHRTVVNTHIPQSFHILVGAMNVSEMCPASRLTYCYPELH